jgi:hypothetical protein
MLKKGNYTESVRPVYTYGFEFIDDETGDILMEYEEVCKKLNESEIEELHEAVLQRVLQQREDLKHV